MTRLEKLIGDTIGILIELQNPETLRDVFELLHVNADFVLLLLIFLPTLKLEFVKLRMNCTGAFA